MTMIRWLVFLNDCFLEETRKLPFAIYTRSSGAQASLIFHCNQLAVIHAAFSHSVIWLGWNFIFAFLCTEQNEEAALDVNLIMVPLNSSFHLLSLGGGIVEITRF
jgi:hypothetical protein